METGVNAAPSAPPSSLSAPSGSTAPTGVSAAPSMTVPIQFDPWPDTELWAQANAPSVQKAGNMRCRIRSAVPNYSPGTDIVITCTAFDLMGSPRLVFDFTVTQTYPTSAAIIDAGNEDYRAPMLDMHEVLGFYGFFNTVTMTVGGTVWFRKTQQDLFMWVHNKARTLAADEFTHFQDMLHCRVAHPCALWRDDALTVLPKRKAAYRTMKILSSNAGSVTVQYVIPVQLPLPIDDLLPNDVLPLDALQAPVQFILTYMTMPLYPTLTTTFYSSESILGQPSTHADDMEPDTTLQSTPPNLQTVAWSSFDNSVARYFGANPMTKLGVGNGVLGSAAACDTHVMFSESTPRIMGTFNSNYLLTAGYLGNNSLSPYNRPNVKAMTVTSGATAYLGLPIAALSLPTSLFALESLETSNAELNTPLSLTSTTSLGLTPINYWWNIERCGFNWQTALRNPAQTGFLSKIVHLAPNTTLLPPSGLPSDLAAPPFHYYQQSVISANTECPGFFNAGAIGNLLSVTTGAAASAPDYYGGSGAGTRTQRLSMAPHFFTAIPAANGILTAASPFATGIIIALAGGSPAVNAASPYLYGTYANWLVNVTGTFSNLATERTGVVEFGNVLTGLCLNRRNVCFSAPVSRFKPQGLAPVLRQTYAWNNLVSNMAVVNSATGLIGLQAASLMGLVLAPFETIHQLGRTLDPLQALSLENLNVWNSRPTASLMFSATTAQLYQITPSPTYDSNVAASIPVATTWTANFLAQSHILNRFSLIKVGSAAATNYFGTAQWSGLLNEQFAGSFQSAICTPVLAFAASVFSDTPNNANFYTLDGAKTQGPAVVGELYKASPYLPIAFAAGYTALSAFGGGSGLCDLAIPCVPNILDCAALFTYPVLFLPIFGSYNVWATWNAAVPSVFAATAAGIASTNGSISYSPGQSALQYLDAGAFGTEATATQQGVFKFADASGLYVGGGLQKPMYADPGLEATIQHIVVSGFNPTGCEVPTHEITNCWIEYLRLPSSPTMVGAIQKQLRSEGLTISGVRFKVIMNPCPTPLMGGVMNSAMSVIINGSRLHGFFFAITSSQWPQIVESLDIRAITVTLGGNQLYNIPMGQIPYPERPIKNYDFSAAWVTGAEAPPPFIMPKMALTNSNPILSLAADTLFSGYNAGSLRHKRNELFNTRFLEFPFCAGGATPLQNAVLQIVVHYSQYMESNTVQPVMLYNTDLSKNGANLIAPSDPITLWNSADINNTSKSSLDLTGAVAEYPYSGQSAPSALLLPLNTSLVFLTILVETVFYNVKIANGWQLTAFE